MELPTLPEYFDQLAAHDWFYEYSDDHKVFTAGSNNNQRLLVIARQSEKHRRLYESYKYWKFDPQQVLKPARPEE